MLFLFYRICIFITLRISLKKAYVMAAVAAKIYSFISFKDRFATHDNLKVLFPSYSKKKIKSMTDEVFVNFCKYLVDFFRFPLMDDNYIKEKIKVEGLENIDNALAKGHGVILTSAHLGNWELGAGVLSKMGYPLNVVVLSHKHRNVNDFFNSRRQLFGVKPIPFGGALRRCFRCLEANEFLALVGDRDYFDNGIQIPFFKKKVIIPRGPAVLSLRFSSPIVPTFMIRNADDTFTFKFCPPIKYQPLGDKDRDIRRLTLSYIAIIEDIIKQYPSQWYVFRRFWEKIGWKL